MYLSYKFIDTGESSELEKIIIVPGNANMAILKAMTNRPDMKIINPACDFSNKMKSGYYTEWNDDDITAEAEIANLISNAWHYKPDENIFSLLTEITRLYVNEKLKTEPPEWLQEK